MLTKTRITGLMVALMALSAPVVFADTAPQKGGWHHGKEAHMMFKILNLTEDQEKQFKDLKQKQKEAMKTVFEQMKSNKEALEAEIAKATPDMTKINSIQAQIKAIQAQMVDAHLNSLLDIKKLMTPEQFAGYMALEKEEHMKKHMMMGHGKFGDMHKHWGDKKDEGDEK